MGHVIGHVKVLDYTGQFCFTHCLVLVVLWCHVHLDDVSRRERVLMMTCEPKKCKGAEFNLVRGSVHF